MDFQLQGINPVLSTGFLLLLFFLTIFVSWFGYSYLSSVPPVKKWSLILLRASVLSILIILLLNPFIRVSETEVQRPEVAVYVDDTKSLDISRGQFGGIEDYRDIIGRFNFENTEDVRYSFYRFGDVVERINSVEPSLTGGITNLEEVMRHIRDQSADAVAAVLFSDGITTRGPDPLFTARELPIPLFTVPVGDSTSIRDISITDVLTDETGYINTIHAVEVTLRQNGYAGSTVTVSLVEDETVLDSEELEFPSGTSVHSVSLQVLFEDEGLRNFEVLVTPGEDEQSVENNEYPFSVDVLDEKTQILHLAFEIHPDVGALRTLLATDESIELVSGTWVGGKFSEGEVFPTGDETADLVILHGSVPENLYLEEYGLNQVPLLQFVTPTVTEAEYGNLAIPVTLTGTGDVINILLNLHESLQNYSILAPELSEGLQYPALQVMSGVYELPVTGTVLASGIHEGDESGIPVIATDETGNRRMAIVTANGWFRLLHSGSNDVNTFAATLLSNLVSWTGTDPDHRNLHLQPVQRQFQETEMIRFLADLTDDTGEPEDAAAIEVILSDNTGNDENFTMRSTGNGKYELSVGRRPGGNYRYEAIARVSGHETDSISGEFIVSESTVEYLNTRRNDQRLMELAEASGGSILNIGTVDGLMNELADRNLLNPVTEHISYFRYMHDSLFWFIAVILLLSAEWILRRRLSLP